MKQKIKYIVAFLFFISSFNLIAQRPQQDDFRERFRAERVAFFTERLDLTPQEAEKFWPVYNEFDGKRWEVQKNRGSLEFKVQGAKNTLSEKEIIQLTRDYASSLKEEGELNISYNEKFLKILPPRKVLALYKVEEEFRVHLMQKLRSGNRNNFNR